MDEYKLRKDIDSLTDIANQLSLILEENDVANLQELLGRFYDKSEVDVYFSQLSSSFDVLYDDSYGTTGGVPNTPETASQNSFKSTLEHLRDTTVPDVSQTATAAKTAGITLKSDLYGTKTVDGKTVPKDSTDTPDADSFKGLIKTVTEEDIPLVKNVAYGEGEYYIDETTQKKVYYDENNPSPNSSLGLAQTVDAGLTTANGHITNIQNMSYGADQIDPNTGQHYTINNPSPDSVSGLANSAIEQIGDPNTSGTILHDIDQAQTDISNAQSDIGTVNRSANGSLQTQILNAPVLLDYLYCALYPYPERQQIHAGVNEMVYVVAYLSNVGKRVYPNGSSLEFTIIAPDNTVTTQSVVRQNQLPNVGIWTSFSQVGDYKIMCCNLSYTLKVGDVSDNWVDKTSDLNQNVASYCKFEINPSLKLAVINYTRDDLTIPSSGTQSVLGIPTNYCPIGNNYVQISSTLNVRLNKKTAQVNAGGFTFLNSGSSTTPHMDFEILYRYR